MSDWPGRKCLMNMNQKQPNVTMSWEKTYERKDGFADAVKDSLSQVKILLCTIFSHLQLKEKNMQNSTLVTKKELSAFWSVIMALDSTLVQDGSYVQENTYFSTWQRWTLSSLFGGLWNWYIRRASPFPKVEGISLSFYANIQHIKNTWSISWIISSTPSCNMS